MSSIADLHQRVSAVVEGRQVNEGGSDNRSVVAEGEFKRPGEYIEVQREQFARNRLRIRADH